MFAFWKYEILNNFFHAYTDTCNINVSDYIPFPLRLCQYLDYFHTWWRLPAPWLPDFPHQWGSPPCRPSPILQLQLWTILHTVGSFGGLLPASVSPAGKRATWPHAEACRSITETLMTDNTWHFPSAVLYKAVKKHFYLISEEQMLIESTQKEGHQQYMQGGSGRVKMLSQVVWKNIVLKLPRSATRFQMFSINSPVNF